MDLIKAILWIVLLVVLVWFGIELTFFIRKMRKHLKGVLDKAEETISSANEAIQELNPALKELQPLISKTETTVDALSLDLLHVNEILSNVNTVTGAASKATNAVSGVVEKASDAIQGAVGKLTGKEKRKGAKQLKEKEGIELTLEGEVEEVTSDEGYFTYDEKDGGGTSHLAGNSEND